MSAPAYNADQFAQDAAATVGSTRAAADTTYTYTTYAYTAADAADDEARPPVSLPLTLVVLAFCVLSWFGLFAAVSLVFGGHR